LLDLSPESTPPSSSSASQFGTLRPATYSIAFSSEGIESFSIDTVNSESVNAGADVLLVGADDGLDPAGLRLRDGDLLKLLGRLEHLLGVPLDLNVSGRLERRRPEGKLDVRRGEDGPFEFEGERVALPVRGGLHDFSALPWPLSP
jgi:hypothetical protein